MGNLLRNYQIEIRSIFNVLEEIINFNVSKEITSLEENVNGQYYIGVGKIELKPNYSKGTLFHEVIHYLDDIFETIIKRKYPQKYKELKQKKEKILFRIWQEFSLSERYFYFRDLDFEFFPYFVSYLYSVVYNDYYLLNKEYVEGYFKKLKKMRLLKRILYFLYDFIEETKGYLPYHLAQYKQKGEII